jgi:tetratricopeptide (TPR) repeat protein
MNTEASPLDAAEVDLNRALAVSAAERGALLDALRQRLLPLPATIEPARQGELLRRVAEQYYLAGDRVEQAIAPIAKAVMLTAAAGDLLALRHARSIQCLVLASCAHFAEAMAAGLGALDLARTLRLPLPEVRAWVNLGFTLERSGLTDEARACTQSAIRLATAIAESSTEINIVSELAVPHHLLAAIWLPLQPARAMDACRLGLKFVSAPQTPYEFQVRALLECTAGTAAIALNDVPAARAHAASARDLAMRAESERVIRATDNLAALLDVRLGQVASGLQGLADCLDRARRQGDTLAQEDALRALVDAYEFLNQPDHAYRHLRDLIELSARRAVSRSLLRSQFTITGQPTDPSGVSIAGSGVPVAGSFADLSDVARRMRDVLSAPRQHAVDQYYAGA